MEIFRDLVLSCKLKRSLGDCYHVSHYDSAYGIDAGLEETCFDAFVSSSAP